MYQIDCDPRVTMTFSIKHRNIKWQNTCYNSTLNCELLTLFGK